MVPAGVLSAGAGSGGGAVLRFADRLSFSLECVSLRVAGRGALTAKAFLSERPASSHSSGLGPRVL